MNESATNPLVTIMIATKDRSNDLRLTLTEMRKQRYLPVDVLVIDDGSAVPVEQSVLNIWPTATIIRHEKSAGQCVRRSEGFARARGKYILQLDDDCSLVDEADLGRAVHIMEEMPQAGCLAFYVVNGPVLPDAIDTSSIKRGCVASFLAGASLMRKTAVDQTDGYRSFFGNEFEEEELALQLLARGWQIAFIPEIVAHHRLSTLNRNSPRTWMRGLRNRLWAMVIHMPLSRLGPEIAWKVAVGAWDAVRLMRISLFFQALGEALLGIKRVRQIRKPLPALAIRRYDALRLHPVITFQDFESPPTVTLNVLVGHARRWLNRPRNRSVWDRRPGDIGYAETVKYAHEFVGRANSDARPSSPRPDG